MSERRSKSVFYKQLDPVKQAIGIGVLGGIGMLIANMGEEKSGLIASWEDVWIVVVTFMLFFAILNSVFMLSADDSNQYFGRSLVCFTILAGLFFLMAQLLTGVSLSESGNFKWILIVIVFAYLVLLSIVMAMQRIVNYAQKQDKKLRNEE